MREQAWSRDGIHDHAASSRRTPVVDAAGPHRRIARFTIALALTLATACASLIRPAFHGANATDAWPTTLATARNLATAGDFDGADSALAQFARQYPGTPAALETAYWRGVFKMDPSNHSASLEAAMASLDGYLADPRPREHVAEATTLRRVAGELADLNKTAASAVAQAKDAKTTAANASANAAAAEAKETAKSADAAAAASAQAEINRLKDELAKANAELDRIRKRLAQPPNKP